MCRNHHLLLWGSLLLLLTASCAKRPDIHNGKLLMPDKTSKLELQGTHSTDLMYTGCGGMIIAHQNEAIITDPFYTGQGLMRVPLGVRINPKNTRRVFDSIRQKLIDPHKINAALIAHAHVDHLLDLPYLLNNDMLNRQLQVIGHRSVYCTIRSFMPAGTSFTDTLNTWVNVSPHIRVMALPSSHAPHTRNRLFLQGTTCPNGIKGFKTPLSSTSLFKWKEGGTVSFLIDLLDTTGKTQTRLYIQSSASQAPDGFPPAELLAERPVDVAFICVASFENVNNYPEKLLQYLNPAKVVLIHWEDFFRKDFMEHPKIIRATSTKKLIERLQQFYQFSSQQLLAERVYMPKPYTVFHLR